MSHITKSINKMPASIHKHQSTNILQFPVITPETKLMMSNLQHGCCTKRSLAMDGLSTLVTFTSLT